MGFTVHTQNSPPPSMTHLLQVVVPQAVSKMRQRVKTYNPVQQMKKILNAQSPCKGQSLFRHHHQAKISYLWKIFGVNTVIIYQYYVLLDGKILEKNNIHKYADIREEQINKLRQAERKGEAKCCVIETSKDCISLLKQVNKYENNFFVHKT